MNARARMLVVVLSGGVLSLLRVPPARGTVEVMKDVTLGFGEALKHCREEVITFSKPNINIYFLISLGTTSSFP